MDGLKEFRRRGLPHAPNGLEASASGLRRGRLRDAAELPMRATRVCLSTLKVGVSGA